MPIASGSGAREWLKGRNKFLTGYCNEIGKPAQHEGTKPTSHGKPLPTCPSWQICPCECHRSVDLLFEATGLERREMPNVEYNPPTSEFLMPIIDDPIGLNDASTSDDIDTPPDIERPPTTPPRIAQTPLAQRRTETGRAARGGLEAQVWDACRSIEENILTPKVVGEWIAEKYHIPTPSSGAINAVWDRWEKLGFCKQGKKPNRFVEFTAEGTWEELARIKQSAKIAKRVSPVKAWMNR